MVLNIFFEVVASRSKMVKRQCLMASRRSDMAEIECDIH